MKDNGSIIVYRNPLEKTFWENPEYFVYGIVFAVILVFGCIGIKALWDKIRGRDKYFR